MNYTGFIAAKNGSLIPTRDALCFHSKYNPEREAEQFAAQFAEENSFFVILGLCGGYHIAALANRFSAATIVVVEHSKADIQFLMQLPQVAELLKNPQIIVTTPEQLSHTLSHTFFPAEHTALQIAALHAWEHAFSSQATAVQTTLKQTLAHISADFSVQSHFGGMWQRNILTNLRLAAAQSPATLSIPHEKIAAIIAAGPRLDDSWHAFKKQRGDYYIIATDTGYRALLRRGIVSDAVVCVDAQMISHAHFFSVAPQTLCILDLSVAPAVARMLARHNPLVFVETGHPLAAYANAISGSPFFHLEAGSGTVTIAALSFAVFAGFARVQFFGADFCYTRGKAYTQGSYLDDLYNNTSTRLHPAETQFSQLVYRTALQACGTDCYTTEVLTAYKNSLKMYLNANNFLEKADNLYIRAHKQREQLLHTTTFDYARFARTYTAELASVATQHTNRQTNAFFTLLPYIAWLKKQQNHADFAVLLRQAYTKTMEYV